MWLQSKITVALGYSEIGGVRVLLTAKDQKESCGPIPEASSLWSEHRYNQQRPFTKGDTPVDTALQRIKGTRSKTA